MNNIIDKYDIEVSYVIENDSINELSATSCDNSIFIIITLVHDFKSYICRKNIKDIYAFEIMTYNNVKIFINYINNLILHKQLNISYDKLTDIYNISFTISNSLVEYIYVFECIYDDNIKNQINNIIKLIKMKDTILYNTTTMDNIFNNINNELIALKQYNDTIIDDMSTLKKELHKKESPKNKLKNISRAFVKCNITIVIFMIIMLCCVFFINIKIKSDVQNEYINLYDYLKVPIYDKFEQIEINIDEKYKIMDTYIRQLDIDYTNKIIELEIKFSKIIEQLNQNNTNIFSQLKDDIINECSHLSDISKYETIKQCTNAINENKATITNEYKRIMQTYEEHVRKGINSHINLSRLDINAL